MSRDWLLYLDDLIAHHYFSLDPQIVWVSGAGLVKKRIARTGGGKSAGYRVLAAADLRRRCVFLYGFAKSERDNVDERELTSLKRIAQAYLGLDEETVERALASGQLMEIDGGESQTA